MDAIKNEFGGFIKDIRKRQGFTQKEVEGKSGIPKHYISMIENRNRHRNRKYLPSLIHMVQLADCYNIHVNVLVDKAVEIIRKDFLGSNKIKPENGRRNK